MQKYDVIVVGAGNGGLSAATYLATAGKKVLVLEKHNLPGGCATSFRRGAYEFEATLHELCQMGDGKEGRPRGAVRKLLEDQYKLDVEWCAAHESFASVATDPDGFITADLIQKYAPEGEYSIFMCGPKAMYVFGEEQCKKLGLPKRRYRMEMSGDYMGVVNNVDYPKDQIGKNYTLTVDIRREKTVIPCKADESLLWAMERTGIKAPAHCRSGECGWCRSRLVKGKVYIPAEADGRRLGDIKFNWIHPCVSFPLSDIELCVFPTAE